ncbi:hypothetical protein FB451DRAFT_1163908 [Mycena latifolia]|nr:hypothetical protein FB451DRAFT_1163908 [Mycena latifolia]
MESAAEDVNSPKKTGKIGDSDDASTHLPSLRTDHERSSPDARHKVSGSGAIRKTAGPDSIPSDVFLAPSASNKAPLLLSTPWTPVRTNRRYGQLRSQSASPSLRCKHVALDTGHHAMDVDASDLEEDQIIEDDPIPAAAASAPGETEDADKPAE